MNKKVNKLQTRTNIIRMCIGESVCVYVYVFSLTLTPTKWHTHRNLLTIVACCWEQYNEREATVWEHAESAVKWKGEGVCVFSVCVF